MPTNASPEFKKAEKLCQLARTDEERLKALEEMMKTMPKHKSAESLRANIRTRYKKLKEKIKKKEKQKKHRRKQEGIKKKGVQIVFCGLTNSGKSSLLSCLTNAEPETASYQYTTKKPEQGMLKYEGIEFQLIDQPAINYETFDQGLTNEADLLLLTITSLNDLEKIRPFLKKAKGKKLVIFNKSDKLNNKEKRKTKETLKSRKLDFVLTSTKTKKGIEKLKQKLLENSNVIRIYTKEPGKKKSEKPLTLKPKSTVKDVAEKIKTGLSKKVKEARLTGPSSKFPNQKVGLSHELKDKDIVEFQID